MSRDPSPGRGSFGTPIPGGSPDRSGGNEASRGVPGGLVDPSPLVSAWTPGESISYAPPGFPGVGAVNGGVTMGGLGKGFGFQIGSGTQGISHGSGAGFATMGNTEGSNGEVPSSN